MAGNRVHACRVRTCPYRFRAAVGALAALALSGARPARAQHAETQQAEPPADSFFPHGDLDHWVSGQANIIAQGHPGFHALYTGEQSLLPTPEAAVSFVGTLFTGFRPTPMTDAIADIEMAAGRAGSPTWTWCATRR
jgi:high affinity Mn2+ porin